MQRLGRRIFFETGGFCINPCVLVVAESDSPLLFLILCPYQALLISSLLLCCSVLNLAASALLLRSGRRNSESLGDTLSSCCFGMSGVLTALTRKKLQRKPPSPMMWQSLKTMSAIW